MNKKIIGILLTLFGATIITVGFVMFRKRKLSLSRNANLLFVGDSYTAANTSYADQLKTSMPQLQIKKIAKVGEKTDWMLQNSKDEINSKKYDAVFILGGINDVYATGNISNAENNLQTMYDLAKKNGAKVIGITIAPTDYYPPYTDAKGQLTDNLNAWIKKNKKLDAAIDFNEMLKTNGVQDLTLFATDKLHALPKGHKMLATTIEKNVFYHK